MLEEIGKNVPIVNGELMLETIKSFEHQKNPTADIASFKAQKEELTERLKRYSTAGFRGMADQMGEAINELSIIESKQKIQDQIEKYKEQGLFVIQMPSSSGLLFVEDLLVPYWIVDEIDYKRRIALDGVYQAMYKVDIENFVGNVPMSVVDVSLEYKKEFRSQSIIFVCPNNKIQEHIKNFPVLDPCLIGHISGNHYAVLAIWGNDLTEINIALDVNNTLKKHR